MRARSLVVVGLAPVAILVAVACGLDDGGLLEFGDDASATPLDATSGAIDGTSLNADGNPAGDDDGASGHDGGDDDGAEALDASDSGPDAGPCSGVLCNGACVDASSCVACFGSPLFCASSGTCGSRCAACPGLPIQCFDCDSNRLNPVATCQPQDASAYCLNSDIYPRYHCGCPDDDAGECPGTTQTCTTYSILTGNVCQTCGEPNTDQAPCKGGGTCDEATAQCK